MGAKATPNVTRKPKRARAQEAEPLLDNNSSEDLVTLETPVLSRKMTKSDRSGSAGFNQMVISGFRSCSAPVPGARIQIKLRHDDGKYTWYYGTMERTRDEDLSDKGPRVTIFKVKFDAVNGDKAHSAWMNLTSKVNSFVMHAP